MHALGTYWLQIVLLLPLLAITGCGKGTGSDRLIPVPETIIRAAEGDLLRPRFVEGAAQIEIATLNLFSGQVHVWFPRDGSYVASAVSPGAVSMTAVMAAEHEGKLYVAAVDGRYRDLYFGVGSTVEVVWNNVFPGLDQVGDALSLLFDPVGNPWIFFANQTSQALWALQGLEQGKRFVPTIIGSGQVDAVAAGIDANGRMYAAWCDAGSGVRFSSLDKKWGTGLLWKGRCAGLDMQVNPATGPDLIYSHPRVTWQDEESGSLWYAELLSGGWQSGAVVSGGRIGGDPALILRADGSARVVMTDLDQLDLVAATENPGQGWITHRLARSGATGFWPDIRIGDTGWPQVVYFDYTRFAVQLLIWEDVPW